MAARLTAPAMSLLGAALILAPAPAFAATGAEAGRPGAYCPLPKAGEVPACLTPAQARYGEFFGALDRGELGDAEASSVEEDLASDSDTAFLALSSLAYGYYRLASEVARGPNAHPTLTARLAHWNRLLLEIYGERGGDDDLRGAVREAAEDLKERSPAPPMGSSSADGLVEALARMDADAGLRSPLRRLLQRLAGPAEPAPAP